MTASHWLLKTEPTSYSFQQLVAERTTRWDGIANPVALGHLRRARKGDVCVVYHSGKERAAVGLAEVGAAPYEYPVGSGAWVVDLIAKKPLASRVELATFKADPAFAASPIVRQGRLSFVPLTPTEYARLMELASG